MGLTELVIFIAMVIVFILGVFALKLPIGLSLVISAISGTLIAGEGIPIRHLVEGEFGYLNTILIIAMAMIFMKVLQKSGLLDTIARQIIVRFYRKPVFLLLSMMLLVMFPGMITGSSTAAVLTTGALVAPVLICMGVPKDKAAVIIAMGAIYGMIAPPINVPAMIIGGGIDMPFIGFGLPLLLASLPLAFIVVIAVGLKYIEKIDFKTIEGNLPNSYYDQHGFKLYLPIILLVVLMLGESLLPQYFPNMGLPVVFLLASFVGIFTGERFNFFKVAKEAIHDALPVLGILMGVGMFIQIMTLTGVRGTIVILCLSLPSVFLYLGIATSLPLFGAISSYGAASVLGVPFVLAFLGQNEIITASSLSLIAGLGDLMPPTALAGMFAAQVVGQKNYFKVLRHCIWPGILTAAYGIFLIINANFVNNLLKSFTGKIYILLGFIVIILATVFVTRMIGKCMLTRVNKGEKNHVDTCL